MSSVSVSIETSKLVVFCGGPSVSELIVKHITFLQPDQINHSDWLCVIIMNLFIRCNIKSLVSLECVGTLLLKIPHR